MPTRTKKEIEPVIEPVEEAPPVQQEDTVTFKRSHFYAVLVVLAFAAGILVGYAAWGTETPQAAVQPNAPAAEAPVAAATQEPVRYDIPTDGAYALGPEDAPIMIVEFSDYQCPYCRRWHEQVYQPLLAAYPGKIRMVYRHLPLTSIHPEAFPAAEASMCAGEQDAFWQYHDKLFSSESLGSQVYSQYARELGLDMTAFEACMTERRYEEVVQKDTDFAIDLGIRSTPTFFINGLALVGAQPLDVFKQIIDKELAGEIPR
ncbi:MAG TPA: DsbA family protein [Anaerolineales bacterium]|nr:DsbA family protein [Anaerolineales bacterium]